MPYNSSSLSDLVVLKYFVALASYNNNNSSSSRSKSKKYFMNEPVAKRIKYNSDRVVLNVGGTQLVTSALTLQSWCTYFERRFSNEWRDNDKNNNSNNNNNDDDNDKDLLFIDHDPADFRCLLSFMRLGQIPANVLTSSVLLLAKFLGMERLLAAVRVVAKRLAFGGDVSLLSAAVSAGVLTPDEAKIQKDFAEMLVYDPEYVTVAGSEDSPDIYRLTIIVEVRASKDVIPKKKTTFIGGLNWLHQLGYTRFEEEISHSDSIEPSIVSQLRFSRLVEDDNNISPNLEGLVIADTEDIHNLNHRREFALFNEIAYTDAGNCCVEADFGEEKVLETLPALLNANDRQRTFKTRTSRLEEINCSKGLNWLQEQGYVKREQQLERWYLNAFKNALEQDELVMVPSMIRLWSRPKTTTAGE